MFAKSFTMARRTGLALLMPCFIAIKNHLLKQTGKKVNLADEDQVVDRAGIGDQQLQVLETQAL